MNEFLKLMFNVFNHLIEYIFVDVLFLVMNYSFIFIYSVAR